MSTLKNKFVYIISNKKLKKEKQVASKGASKGGFLVEALKSEATVSKEVVELREKFCCYIEYYQKSAKNEGERKNEASEAHIENELENLKKFLINHSDSKGRLPSEKTILETFKEFNRMKLFRLKAKLCEIGFLYKENDRVYKINLKEKEN